MERRVFASKHKIYSTLFVTALLSTSLVDARKLAKRQSGDDVITDIFANDDTLTDSIQDETLTVDTQPGGDTLTDSIPDGDVIASTKPDDNVIIDNNIDDDVITDINPGGDVIINNSHDDVIKNTKPDVDVSGTTPVTDAAEPGEGFEVPPDLPLDGAGEDTSRQCTRCRPGQGVVSVCNATHDTMCAACVEGTYQMFPTLDAPCTPCSQCPARHYTRRPCIPTHNVDCERCSNRPSTNQGAGFGNEDFLHKCEPYIGLPTTPPATQPASLPPGVVRPTKAWPQPPDQPPIMPPTDSSGVVIGGEGGHPTPRAGESVQDGDEGNGGKRGGFPWPIIVGVAGTVAAFVIITAIMCYYIRKKDPSKKQAPPPKPLAEAKLKSPMLPDHYATRYSGDYDEVYDDRNEEINPMYKGRSDDNLDLGSRPKSFYESKEGIFVDDYSDDEIVAGLGRPFSIFYREKFWKDRKRPKLFRKLRKHLYKKNRRSYTGSTGSAGGSRPSSVYSEASVASSVSEVGGTTLGKDAKRTDKKRTHDSQV